MLIKKKLIMLLSRFFNWYFDFYTDRKKRPVFFDIGETCKELNIIDYNFDTIEAELQQILRHPEAIPKYHEVDPLQYDISAKKSPASSWKTYMIYLMGEFSSTAETQCPQTCDLLNRVPGIYQSFFSILEPRKEIPLHNGMYRGYLRYHLALEVPKTNPPSLIIKNISYMWEKKQSVLFDDSWQHEVLNKSDERRIVLVIDIYRPMPYLPDKVNHIITKFLIKRFYANKVLRNINTHGKF
jgi:aspartate beta-hydroxylase/beta-hydroxylase